MILLAESRKKHGWSQKKIQSFLVTRGLILIGCQVLLESPAWLFGLVGGHMEATKAPGGGGVPFVYFGILSCLGVTMICWALLMRFKPALWAIAGVSAIAVTQFLMPGAEQVDHLFSPPMRLLLVPGQSGVLQVYYPILPWMGLTGLGLLCGRLLLKHKRKAMQLAFGFGVVLLVSFGVVRNMGGFGNFHPPGTGWIGFLNVTKHPPSLVMLLMALGTCLVLLGVLDVVSRQSDALVHPLVVFGRVPFLFYIVHLYLYGIIGLAFPRGANLWLLYVVWGGGLCVLYPLCRWYNGFKRGKPSESVWRFF